VVLERRGDALYGRGHERTKMWIAVRGRGIFEARSLLSAETLLEETQVHFIVRLIRRPPEQAVVPGGECGSFLEVEGIPLSCRRIAAGGGSDKLGDEVIGCVNEYLAREKRASAEDGNEEAVARGDHYGAVRFG
jgi:serine kinase of HPr protein (carbohydrate metabolism regulator)